MSEYKQSLSKFISLILRHKPETIGITLDSHGWAVVDELLKGINEKGKPITFDDLCEIVRTDAKGRYSFNEDKTLIRANQGHSISVDADLVESIPPDILFHGTATKVSEIIQKEGIKPMSRLYVHLSDNTDTATNVGKRHGKPIVFRINTKKMYEDGIKFYLSANKVWLTKYVEPKYIIDKQEVQE